IRDSGSIRYERNILRLELDRNVLNLGGSVDNNRKCSGQLKWEPPRDDLHSAQHGHHQRHSDRGERGGDPGGVNR
ncbi:MAG: hypothetical protein KUG77_18335, partial [Nannocystaceae bacterium]|nr:hypothetical protein [Nannocystaceae bacterium]